MYFNSTYNNTIIQKVLKERRNKMEINKDMAIGDFLEKYPEKAEILMNAGMHCLGCIAASGETLEQACEVHGIDVNELIEELNK